MESAIIVVIGYETKLLMKKKYVVVRKIEKVVVVNGSWGLQKTELQGLQLGVVLLKNQAKRRGGLYSWLVDARATAHDKAWQ